ncbi:MAG: histidine kinase [Burkholderiaceae bacterium]|uniref:Histidine kinase n=1 Tax=Herminiimonas contaminans TaxID=1111140 RepID=A0ABS0ER59_9BURK|nr:histidine kinase [Herminiimonas contaminans]MBF8177336.1 histidine kinase [Herminiimonas contaminans]MBX9799948.1 histidine kinase [Burkholderiaceae bacterium]
MKSNLIGLLVASMFALPAWAGSPHGHGGSGSGSGGSAVPTSNSSSSATGGAGGAGGAATGGSATGGSASGGASNVNVSVNTGSGGGASPAAAALGDVGAPGSSANNTKATVDYGGSYTVKNVPGVLAPSLTTTLSDTCMGSVSLGVSAVGFGLTGGITMVDEACVRRLDSREFRAMGMNDVALALLCQSEANRKAIEATGRSCPSAPKQDAANPVQTYSVMQSSADQYTDPIVRKRMGLEPLP